MRKYLVCDLLPGMVVARDIYNLNGTLMLRRGIALTAAYIRSLSKRGFMVVPVQDGIADDIEPPQILSDQVRVATTKHLQELFKLSARPLIEPASRRSKPGSKSALTKKDAAYYVTQLSHDVESIVQDVLSAEVIDGIITLKSHDNYTFEHSVEVTVVSVMLGKRLRLSPDHLRQLALGSMLHDIGKVIVPASILNKIEPLTPEEFELIKKHPQTGYDLMCNLFPYDDILARHVVYQHHERQDGLGYPQNLRGQNNLDQYLNQRYQNSGYMLPVAEVAAVADVYSALASDRPYRPAMAHEQIVQLLREMAGTHLNRDVATCFLSICPIHPVGSDVTFIAGHWSGFRGIVSAVDSRNVERPVVRILFDPDGGEVEPVEFDTSKDDMAQFASSVKVLAPA